MSEETDSLRELYVAVAGEEVITETQEESPSHESLGDSETELERTVSDAAYKDGLTDAVE